MGIFLKHSCVRVVCIITFFTSLCVVDHTHIFNLLNEYTLKKTHKHNRYAFRKNDPHEDSDCVVFWDTTSKEVFVKYISRVISIRSSGDMCVIASGTDDGSGQFELTLCNAIGNPVDSKRIDIEPLLVTMTECHVVVCDKETICVWQYRTQISRLTSVNKGGSTSSVKRSEGRERYFNVEDSVAEHTNYKDYARKKMRNRKRGVGVAADNTICASCASERFLMIARQSGTIQIYTLPYISLERKIETNCRPQQIKLNCDSSKMSCIGVNSVLSVYVADIRCLVIFFCFCLSLL